MTNPGKRLSTDDPLTEHDVAERLSAAMLRVYRILSDVVADPTLHFHVKHSRYLSMMPSESEQMLARFREGPTVGCRCGHPVAQHRIAWCDAQPCDCVAYTAAAQPPGAAGH